MLILTSFNSFTKGSNKVEVPVELDILSGALTYSSESEVLFNTTLLYNVDRIKLIQITLIINTNILTSLDDEDTKSTN